MDADKKFPVVGIGASAGGLDAFLHLLKELEAKTGFAYVFIQHLLPDHDSILSELLSKGTHIPVLTVKNNLQIEPDNVYVIPPGKLISLNKGRFVVKKAATGIRMPIDFFFKNIAAEYGELSMGVVLSGTASDGTLGLREIQAAGGITFVQDEASAAFTGMPHNAIQDTVIDYILPPGDIAKEIVRLSQVFSKEEILVHESSDDEFNRLKEKIFKLVRAKTGVDFFYYKSNTINRRISRRMLLTNTKGINEYYNYVKSNPGELEILYKDLLINVTNFFRDPDTFENLKEVVYPTIFKEVGDVNPIRVWVPACSTGEEVYSIAITLLEFFGVNDKRNIQLFATDISDNAIEKARLGVYDTTIEQDVSSKRLKKFFKKVDGKYQINRSIRDMVVFAHHDVTKDPPFSKLDLVSCRNLLIYLSPELQRRVIPLFHFALKATGFLVLGNNESIGGYNDLFSLEDKKNKIYSKRASVKVEYNMNISVPFMQKKQKKTATATEQDFLSEVDNLIFSKNSVCAFLVNDAMDIVLFRGDTSNFIEPVPGTASLNLFKLLNQDILIELTTLLHHYKLEKAPLKRVSMHYHGRELAIEILPVNQTGNRNEPLILIIFQETNISEQLLPTEMLEETGANGKAVFQELKITKEYLQSIIEERESSNEELRSALEELQSSNEELQSINEEMETAKEELQSTNEELTTVNDELQSRNNELLQLNNDLVNILSSVNIPIILLDNEMRIRRYTPVTEKIFNIIPSDIGRPVTDLRANIKIDNIEKIIEEVLESLTTKTLETQDNQDRWYSLRIRPYRTTENKIDGVILTLVDIDVQNKSNKEIEFSKKLTDCIVDTAMQPMVILDENMKIIKANKAFNKFFWIAPSETDSFNIFEINNRVFNIPKLREAIEDHNSEAQVQEPLVIEGSFRDGKSVSKLMVNVRKVFAEDSKLNVIVSFAENNNGYN